MSLHIRSHRHASRRDHHFDTAGSDNFNSPGLVLPKYDNPSYIKEELSFKRTIHFTNDRPNDNNRGSSGPNPVKRSWGVEVNALDTDGNPVGRTKRFTVSQHPSRPNDYDNGYCDPATYSSQVSSRKDTFWVSWLGANTRRHSGDMDIYGGRDATIDHLVTGEIPASPMATRQSLGHAVARHTSPTGIGSAIDLDNLSTPSQLSRQTTKMVITLESCPGTSTILIGTHSTAPMSTTGTTTVVVRRETSTIRGTPRRRPSRIPWTLEGRISRDLRWTGTIDGDIRIWHGRVWLLMWMGPGTLRHLGGECTRADEAHCSITDGNGTFRESGTPSILQLSSSREGQADLNSISEHGR